MNYNQFKNEFEHKYSSISEFISDYESGKMNHFLVATSFELVENREISTVENDSYGYGEDIRELSKVFHFKNYNCYVKFMGSYSSYNGEVWRSMFEVKPLTKMITNYEPVS